MDQYRKKPVVIEAARLTAEAADELTAWCSGSRIGQGVAIPTLEGVMTASWGDWIICGVQGEFYPCKDTIFTQTYDPVSA